MITEEIKRDKTGKKKWEHIDKLTGKKEKVGQLEEMYDINGNKLEEKEGREGLKLEWKEIYKSGRK